MFLTNYGPILNLLFCQDHWDTGLNTASTVNQHSKYLNSRWLLTNFNQVSEWYKVEHWLTLNTEHSSKVSVSVLLDLHLTPWITVLLTVTWLKNSPTIVPVLLGVILWPLEFIGLIEWLWHVELLRAQVLYPLYSVYICCLWVIFYRTLMLAIIFMQMTHRRLQSKKECVTV